MNTWVPPCLLALELGPDADERTIRRAYARRLKLIDPEADPAAFQALREPLEAALRWAAWRAQNADATDDEADDAEADDDSPAASRVDDLPPDPAPPVPVTVAAPAPALEPVAQPVAEPEPGELAFAGFHARLQRGLASEDGGTLLLEAALADALLVNLEARTYFEWRMACLLASGWQPGHEFLFQPASTVFSWESDRRRLALFGPVGAMLDAAIRERLIFLAQDEKAIDAQRQLMRRLRVEGPGSDLAPQMSLLGLLLQRFPNWTRAMTRQEIVQRWITAWNALTPPEREAAQRRIMPTLTPPPSSYKPERSGGGFGMGWMAVVAVIALVRFLGATGDHGGPRTQFDLSQPPRLETTTAPPAPAYTPLPGTDNPLTQYPIVPAHTPRVAPVAAPPAEHGTGRRAERMLTRQELEALVRNAAKTPASPAPRPLDARYRLEPEPGSAKDPAGFDPGRRYGASPLPPTDFHLVTPGDATHVPGLVDLTHPAPPPPPSDPAR
jgi:protein TonB